MRLLAAFFILYPSSFLLSQDAPLRQLSRADEEWVAKKHAEAVTFGRAGKWGHDEAQAPVRDILARCTSVLGKTTSEPPTTGGRSRP